MLRAYFDAGFQPQTRVYYVAGYVGFPDHWTVFNRKWRAFLRRNGLPYFHMTDYVAGKNRYYRNWSDPKRIAVMERIVALAAEAVRLGMAAALHLDDYDRMSAEDQKLIPEPYGLCLTACIAKTARLLHRSGITTEIDYVFESGDAGQGRTRVALEELFANSAKKKQCALHSLTFEPKARFPGLQLADVLAWETGRYVPLALGWKSSPLRKSFRGLLVSNQHSGVLFDFDNLSQMAARERKRRAPRRGSPSA